METQTLINVVPFAEEARYKRVTYEQVKRACGKRRCSTCGGRTPAHGPYWQRVEWDEMGRKTRTTYIGKQLPPEAEEALRLRHFLTDPDFRQLVYQTEELVQERDRLCEQRTRLEQRIAHIEQELFEARRQARTSSRSRTAKGAQAAKLYHQLARKYHPDRNPAMAEVMRDINQLWQAVE